MKEKLLFIFNPRSGKGTYTSRLTDILTVLSNGGYRVETYPTQKHGDAAERAMRAEEDIAVVAAAGGDGTLNEVINGLYAGRHPLPVGYIPVGSTNDFAASLELPGDPVKAAELIVKRNTRAIDLGLFNDSTFVYVAAFGAFTNVAYETDQKLKNIFGHAAYILSGVRAIGEIKAYPMTVTIRKDEDGTEQVSEGRFIYGMITNSISVGGFRNITGKYVALSDGLFEVTLIREPKDILDLQGIVATLLGSAAGSPLVENYKTSAISFVTEEPIPWTLDGEFGGNHKEVRINNLKEVLQICI
ncbi:MAG: diacylglycerol kinase family lipid kinase [Lachnospiraceae bacterium]|nr:diacylglycerol kinase family lipid kinase [Lachnospiraceae bacterium]